MNCELLIELEVAHACIRAAMDHITTLEEDKRRLEARLENRGGER